MALNTNELYSRVTTSPLPRIQPAEGPGAVQVRQFAGGTAETLPIGTPVYCNGSGLVAKIVPAGTAHASVANTSAEAIFGFVYPYPVTTAASGEVHGTVMTKGSVQYEDVLAIQTAGTIASTETNLKLCLRHPIVRYRDLHIAGLDLTN